MVDKQQSINHVANKPLICLLFPEPTVYCL